MRSRIYFIRGGDLVKIGVTDDVRQRLRQLQVGSPTKLELIGEMPGDENYERALHRAFAGLAEHGEWFRLDGKLAEFIALLPVYEHDERPTARRARLEKPRGVPMVQLPEFREFWAEHLSMIRDAVLKFGAENFAKLVGTRLWHVHAALAERGKYSVPGRWIAYLRHTMTRDEFMRFIHHEYTGPTGDEPEIIQRERAAGRFS
jgi:hypothetical protein